MLDQIKSEYLRRFEGATPGDMAALLTAHQVAIVQLQRSLGLSRPTAALILLDWVTTYVEEVLANTDRQTRDASAGTFV